MGNFFKDRSRIVHISWLVILLYAVSSVYLLIASVNWARLNSYTRLRTEPLIVYTVTSFLLVALVSIYHLASLLRRRRRRTDRQRLSRAKFVRAKHRRSHGG
ncbi:MAG: hypothetical protein LBD48_14820 [Treponema sp.]|jgi:ABC-type nickel/cobalt efflux system permease component RcnA|nr:hypothetical protein [Treponema sp.]